jgi:thioredoxin-dependent peroxiredoxin
MLKIGDSVPEFDVVASNKTHLRSSDFTGKKNLVIYFYPKDFTGVCTRETCGFRDMLAQMNSDSLQVIGVSADDNETHERFAQEYAVTFPLVADPKHELAKKFGASSGFLKFVAGTTKRITYVIDKKGIVVAIFDSLISADKHLDGVKAALAKL